MLKTPNKPPRNLRIIYEDRDLLVVNKPAGLLTSTVPREKRPTLLAMVREYLYQTDRRARMGLIHRLDKDAAGLLVFSKQPAAYESLKTQFFRHTVTRLYTAVVQGTLDPQRGTIRSRLIERADGTVYSTHKHAAGQIAETEYEVLGKMANGRFLVQVKLQTGRKHQVRVHLSERGAPIVGDSMYGKADKAGLHLAATTLAFDHPRTGKRVEFHAEAPFGVGLPADRARPTKK
jgi:RluA family pseudouridine synthase